MTKLTVNRLAHALDDLASHMDVDQFALASFSEDHKEVSKRSWRAASRASRGSRVQAFLQGSSTLIARSCHRTRSDLEQTAELHSGNIPILKKRRSSDA
jgi:hypothetical protein